MDRRVVHARHNTVATATLAYGDYDDAKAAISRATSVRANKVLEEHWPLMSAADMLAMDAYKDAAGRDRHELVDLMNDFLGLV